MPPLLLKRPSFLPVALTVLSLAGLVSGCAGGGSSSRSVSLNDGINVVQSAALVTSIRDSQEFQNLSAFGLNGTASPESAQHPSAFTKVDEAYGYRYSGLGQTIAVLDSGFNSASDFVAGRAFNELQTKYNQGRLLIGGNMTSESSGHGNYVASIAAAPFDNVGYDYYTNTAGAAFTPYVGNAFDVYNHGMMGTAYNARLHLTDYNHFVGPAGWAQATQLATAVGAKVQNNSWALCAPGASCIGPDPRQFNMAELGETLAGYPGASSRNASLDWLVQRTGTGTAADWNAYVSSLEAFQRQGVVVFALQNTASASSPSITAALPELFSSLRGAWIAVGNLDSNRSLKSAPCGVTGPYCLMADGHEIAGASLSNLAGYLRGTGTSSATPQVSGMVAILAEAFPGMSPSVMVARLLATADNSFFTPTNTVDFGGGIQHGYSNIYGHGVPNLQAALLPITSSIRPQSFLITNTQGVPTALVSLNRSGLSSSIAFGDSFQKGLENQYTLSFDALGGAFRTGLNDFVTAQPRGRFGIGLSSHLNGLRGLSSSGGVLPWALERQLQSRFAELGRNTQAHVFATLDEVSNQLHASGIDAQASKSAERLLFGFDAIDRSLPFIQDKETFGMSYSLSANVSTFIFNSTRQASDSTGQAFNLIGGQDGPRTFGLGFVTHSSWETGGNLKWIVGIQREEHAFRGAASEGALQAGETTQSLFVAPKFTKALGAGRTLEMGASLGWSETKSSSGSSLIQTIEPYLSSGFYSEFRQAAFLHPEGLGFARLWQPERAESGSATLGLPRFNRQTMSIETMAYEFSLVPSGREMNLSLGYQLGRTDRTLWGVVFNNKWNERHNADKAATQSVAFTLHRMF
jgi:subtilase-type serine protease